MSESARGMIPYEKQSDQQASRSCGAACLSMAYRSLGKEVPQDEIWPAIAKPNRFGSLASTTHLMAQDALNRGFSGVAIQARHPLQVLRICRDFGIRAILNHRLRRDAPTGHYSVFVYIDEQSVVLHDPLLGPSRRLSHAELLELWLPHFANSEIAGNMLIAVADVGMPPADPCEFCRTPIPLSVECPRCQKPVNLRPGTLLGCVNDACIARMWSGVCCPSCDYVWTFGAHPAQAGASARSSDAVAPSSPDVLAASSPAVGVDLNKLFGEFERFRSLVLTMPAAANHPEIIKQLEQFAAGKEKFKLAYAEQVARSAMVQGQFAALIQATKEKEEAQRRKMEELNTPSPPLDGDALGRALMKNLGFTN